MMLCLRDWFLVNASANVDVAAVFEGMSVYMYLLKHLLRSFIAAMGQLPELSIQVRLQQEVG